MELRRAIIFANGELRSPHILSTFLKPDDLLVAADGGVYNLERLGLGPALVVGDLDSLAAVEVERLEKAGVEIRRFPQDKDETDLELAIGIVQKMGFRTIRIVAALGGRLDHSLGNIFLLLLPTLDDCDVRLEDGREEVMLIHDHLEIEGQPGDTISLLPLNGAASGIVTSGLRYPLQDETLFPERTRGISNVMLAETASVSLKSGRLLCIHTRRSW